MLKIAEKEIEVFYPVTDKKSLPVIVLNVYQKEDGRKVWNICHKFDVGNFILIVISNLSWSQDMTPWPSKNIINQTSDFAGDADYYLTLLEQEILPSVEDKIKSHYFISYYALVGYSLAGLFALYASYKTDKFTRVASISGSFWYPGFLDFVKESSINSGLEKVYFSLGKKEKNSKNKLLQSVESVTKEIENFYSHHQIKTIYEENEGNHFQDSDIRCAKGIRWILNDKYEG